ncbi:MAG: DNA translocase FtsK [Candidatus Doudnabacteria bacterium]|nr:DNA translocase FtsK [Candidatus Doudnabacteria bacterium]
MSRRRRKYYSYTRQANEGAPLGLNLSGETRRGIAIIAFLAAAVITSLAILDYAGSIGRIIRDLLQLLVGRAAVVSPVFFLAVVLSLVLGSRRKVKEPAGRDEDKAQSSLSRAYLGGFVFVLAVTGILYVLALSGKNSSPFELTTLKEGGGYLGIFTGLPLYSLMGFGASLVILAALLLIAFLVAFDLSFHGLVTALGKFLIKFVFQRKTSESNQETPPAAQEQVKINTMESLGFVASALKKPMQSKLPEQVIKESDETPASFDRDSSDSAPTGEARDGVSIPASLARFRKGIWQLPPVELLVEPESLVASGNIEASVKIIKKTLEDFGVFVEMGEVNVGPTVTQYTFRPAVGVKLAQIISRRDDLALALAAPSIRVEAPIPGKSLVGIEVPNSAKSMVGLRSLVDSETFRNSTANLLFALGRDVAGHPMMADLAKMPHLLIAGATGAGKSVCINTVLTCFLYRNSPEELRLIIIDPKRVELTLYNGIPHLLTPVVTDHKQAIAVLKWMVMEMDQRYRRLAEAGQRNIEEYNQSVSEKLPYLVLVVDELADLMAVAKVDVESAIVRLAQMARAVGLHLILATQRPSVNILTGLIKANITCRIAFSVASQVDSRTILDMAGAEDLLGHGDMLYTAPNLPRPKRIQAPFISEREARGVVDFIQQQAGEFEYQEIASRKTAGGNGLEDWSGEDEMDDELLNAAIEEIRRAKKASASLLQRRLQVGYARAARILDILEDRGLVGPADGAKPREIYIEESPDQ